MKKAFRLCFLALMASIMMFTGCGNPGSSDESTNPCAGQSNGHMLNADKPGDGICWCGKKITPDDFAKMREVGAVCGPTSTDAGSGCVVGAKCPVEGATCTSPAGELVCQPCGYLPKGSSCPALDAGTDTGSTTTDSGSTADSGSTDTGTIPPVDTGATTDTGSTTTAGAYWVKACAASADVSSSKDISISQWGDSTSPTSWSSCSMTKTTGGLDCVSCVLGVRAGKPADFNADLRFTRSVTLSADDGKSIAQDHIFSCYRAKSGGTMFRYGTFEAKKPDGSSCTLTMVDNGVDGCNLRCN